MYQRYFKRAFDIISSAVALFLFSPVLISLAWLVRSKLGTPVIFRQTRPGKNGKLFRLYKFRSMTDERDKDGKLLPDAERMTNFGRKLRATSLDELPELINILKGDMSVVGPRPQLVRDMVFFTPEEMKRQSVLPGLTGLAQVSGRNNIDWKERFRYDLQYIRHITFAEDMNIIYRTIFKVGGQEDVSTDGMETSEDYGDWLLRKNMTTLDVYEANQIRAKQILEQFEMSGGKEESAWEGNSPY